MPAAAADLGRKVYVAHYLYGSARQSIAASIREGRKGVSPAFEGKLAPAQIKAVAYYLFSVWEKAPK